MPEHYFYPTDDGPRAVLVDWSKLTKMELGTLVTMLREAMTTAKTLPMFFEARSLYIEVRSAFIRKFFEVV
jgi:hypothetical protein